MNETEATYRCLGCGRTVERAEGEKLPEGDERCSHEWEPVEDDGDPALLLLQAEGRTYLCTVCHTSSVDALNGEDTCAECLAKR